MTPKEKAIELISDYSEIHLLDQYELAKICALYAANTAKWSHPSDSKEFNYWEQVKKEIQLL
ncbi:MAG TPA: hypothetical protein VIH28_08270 [Ignavibacteriaceae bacterium]